MTSRKEIEKQIAALTAELENADTDDVVYIKDGDHEIRVSGKRATSILGRYAHLWETEDDAETEPETDASAGDEDVTDDADSAEDKPVPDKKPSTGYFGRRK